MISSSAATNTKAVDISQRELAQPDERSPRLETRKAPSDRALAALQNCRPARWHHRAFPRLV